MVGHRRVALRYRDCSEGSETMKAALLQWRIIGIALVALVLATLWAVAVHDGWKCENARAICPVCVVAGGSWAPSENHCYEIQQLVLHFEWNAATDFTPQQTTRRHALPRAPPSSTFFTNWASVS